MHFISHSPICERCSCCLPFSSYIIFSWDLLQSRAQSHKLSDGIEVIKEKSCLGSAAEGDKHLGKEALTDSLKTSFDIREVAHP